MGIYILKRLLIIIPTLFAIMVISFLISLNTPGDPVDRELSFGMQRPVLMTRAEADREYRRVSHRLGKDLPVFYFSLTSVAYPDTLHRILRIPEREALDELINTYGNWPEISEYYHTLARVEAEAFVLDPPAEIQREVLDVKLALGEMKRSPTKNEIMYRLDLIDSLSALHSGFLGKIGQGAKEVRNKFQEVEDNATTWKLYVPSIHFYGFTNQFHHWLKRMLRLDLGYSYYDKMKVTTKIREAAPWTFFMGLFSFIIAYLIAIPVGVYSVRNRNSTQDKLVTVLLFLMYSIPSFVMAMLLITLLCNPDYIYLFPTSGVASDGAETWGFFAQLKDYIWHLTLPILCYSYGGVAFISRQMRSGMIENINMDYIRTARAKGLSEKVVIWKHAFRNSVIPIITHFANLLPRLVSGAIIIETIFSIPGMGRMSYNACVQVDVPTIMAVFTISAILTMLGILFSDILYAIADPRISYSKR